MLMTFTPVLVFVFFTVFTVDIPRVFVFIYDYWFKIGGGEIVKSTVQ